MALPVARRRNGGTQQTVQRWDPFREFEDLYNQMGQLIGGVVPGEAGEHPWLPFADIEETEDAWIIEADLPGVERANVNVEMRDAELMVHGDILAKERKGIIRRRTRPTGRFELRVMLPGPIDADKIDAKLKDGVLTVRVPKSEQARPRRIEVSSS
jgi:HSP20 family protein